MNFFWKRLLELVVYLSAILSVYAVVINYWALATTDARYGLVIIGLIAAFFIGYSLVREIQFRRRARYAEAFTILQDAYAISATAPIAPYKNPRSATADMQLICNLIVQAYHLITGKKCAASIRAGYSAKDSEGSPTLMFNQVARDSASYNRAQKGQGPILFPMLDNTSIAFVCHNQRNNEASVFFENDIIGRYLRHNYKTSYFKIYKEPRVSTIPLYNRYAIEAKWTLPFRSGIVAPIYFCPASVGQGKLQSTEIIGLLSIDCESRNSFKRRYDTKIALGLAAVVAPLLSRYNVMLSQEARAESGSAGGIEESVVREDITQEKGGS